MLWYCHMPVHQCGKKYYHCTGICKLIIMSMANTSVLMIEGLTCFFCSAALDCLTRSFLTKAWPLMGPFQPGTRLTGTPGLRGCHWPTPILSIHQAYTNTKHTPGLHQVNPDTRLEELAFKQLQLKHWPLENEIRSENRNPTLLQARRKTELKTMKQQKHNILKP